jgi:AbrB family looped-hinge helix DNA binding protein
MRTTASNEKDGMPIIKLMQSGQVTLPAELRKRFRLSSGDYLEAEATDRGILLKPVTVVDREKAWDELMAIIDEDKWVGPEPRPSPEEEEGMIFEEVEAFRHRS